METKSERIKKLKLLIEQTEKEIELKDSSLEKIDEDISLANEEIKTAEENLVRLSAPKIFTLEELERRRDLELQMKKEKLEEEKSSISNITKKELERASEIRLAAENKSEQEKQAAHNLAKSIEIQALKREIRILNEILNEKNKIYENLIAETVCDDSKFKIDSHLKSAGKEEPGKLKARIKSLKASGAKVKKEINDLSLRIKKSFAKLKLCENK